MPSLTKISLLSSLPILEVFFNDIIIKVEDKLSTTCFEEMKKK